MEQNALTAIVPIKPEELEALRKILTEIGNDIKNNQLVRFSETPSTHFARWVILEDRGLDTDPKFPRLLFTSNYDGTFENYMQELVEKVGSGMEQVWNKCQGYSPGTSQDSIRFAEFIKNHSFKSNAFYVGFRGATVKDILNSMEIRKIIDQILDQVDHKEIKGLKELAKLLPRPPQTLAQPSASSTKLLPGENVARQPKLSLFERLLEWLVGVRPGEKNRNKVELNPDLIKQLTKIEDKAVVVQNQMTIVSPIKPQWLQRLLLRLVLWAAEHQPKSSAGSLLGISTIHFARWAIIDDGNNLLFESNYDGSWESYIDDFVDYASVGMNGIWGSAINFPTGGCRDIEGFKQIIRYYQLPTQVFYSAYPDATVKNILNDLELSKAIAELLQNKKVERFLTGAYGSPV
jgi:hypothetical protein